MDKKDKTKIISKYSKKIRGITKKRDEIYSKCCKELNIKEGVKNERGSLQDDKLFDYMYNFSGSVEGILESIKNADDSKQKM